MAEGGVGMTRIALRPPVKPRAPRAPLDLAARVTERARLMRQRTTVVTLTGALLGDPLPGRSALDRRIDERLADLDRTPAERARARIAGVGMEP